MKFGAKALECLNWADMPDSAPVLEPLLDEFNARAPLSQTAQQGPPACRAAQVKGCWIGWRRCFADYFVLAACIDLPSFAVLVSFEFPSEKTAAIAINVRRDAPTTALIASH
jgi:hypothetical protein